MEWTPEQLKMHREAARLLEGIKNEAFSFVLASLNEGIPVTERDVVSLIRQRFEENFLVADPEVPIVAFGASAAEPHYAAPVKGSKVITRGNVLLIDLWGKIDIEEAPSWYCAVLSASVVFVPACHSARSAAVSWEKMWWCTRMIESLSA